MFSMLLLSHCLSSHCFSKYNDNMPKRKKNLNLSKINKVILLFYHNILIVTGGSQELKMSDYWFFFQEGK